MARALICTMVLLALSACVSSQCIECNRCTPGNSYCLRNCQRSCGPVFDARRCQNYGNQAGVREGNEACRMTQTFCSQAPSASKRTFGYVPVNLDQCQNVAFGACQSTGRTTAQRGQCRWAFNGYRACSARQFQDFFNSELNARCNRAASQIR